MNRLIIKKNNYWYDVDLGEEDIFLNVGTNDFSEVKDFEADYSEEISLPMTEANISIFGGADHLASVAFEPYETYECRLFVDGLPIATSGSSLLLLGCDAKSFKAQVLFGGVGALDAMKEINFEEDVDVLGEITLPMYDKGTPSIQDGDNSIPYAYGDGQTSFFVSAKGTKKNTDTFSNVFAYDIPLIRFGNPNGAEGVMKTIFDTIGYSLDTDVPDKILDQLFLSMPKRKAKENQGQIINVDGHPQQSCITPSSTTSSVVQGQQIDGAVSANSRLFAQGTNGTRISLPLLHDGIRLNAAIDIPRNATNDAVLARSHKLCLYVNGSLVSSTTNALGGWTTSFVLAEDLTFADVKCVFDTLSGTIGGARIRYYFDYVGSSNIDYAQPGTTMKVAPNIGFKNGLEFFKAFVQLFRLKVRINNTTKVIEAKTMQSIIGNKDVALDLTKKVIDFGATNFHRKSFGQHNHLMFGDNKEADFTDSVTIDIADRTLELEKNLTKMPFESGVDRSTGTQIEFFKVDDEGLLEYNESNAPHLIYEQIIVSPTSTSYSLKHHSANDVKAYYAPYLTAQHRSLSASVILLANEIVNFDAFRPIFLRQASRYFVVESISDWNGKKASLNLTRIE